MPSTVPSSGRDIESFVAREAVDAVVIPGRYELAPLSGVRYVAFVDPSGGSQDSMTLAVAHEEHGRAILDCVREVRPPFSPDAVVAEFAATLQRYGISRVQGDRYGGEWPRERFSVRDVSYDVAERSKLDLYLEFLPLLNSGRVELLDHAHAWSASSAPSNGAPLVVAAIRWIIRRVVTMT